MTGATSLSIDHGVGAVTPNTVGAKTVLVAATTLFQLTATNDAGSSYQTTQVTVALPPPSQTVNGTVVDNSGQPVGGETVIISSAGGSQTVVTDGDGGFSVPNVQTPYNATVVQSTQAIEYEGLTRSNPSLTAFFYLPLNRSATLTGQFTGGLYPEDAGYNTAFLFASPQTTRSLGNQPSGSYSANVSWAGPSSTTGTLFALQIHSVSGLPVDYPGYGSLSGVMLQDTVTLPGQNVHLVPVTTGTLSGTVSAPPGYNVFAKSMSLQVASGVSLSLVYDIDGDGGFSFVAPSIANTQIIATGAAISSGGEYSAILQAGLSANSTVALNIPAAPILILPPDGGSGVTTTTPFQWTAYPGGIHEFKASSVPSGSGPTFYVLTAATTATLPDLADAGLPIPASTTYNWEVIGLAPVATVDVLVAPGGIGGLTIDLGEGLSATRKFTTAP